MEGYRLVGQQRGWQLLWAIAFPQLEGAEAWIEAEIAVQDGEVIHATLCFCMEKGNYVFRRIPDDLY